MCFSGIHEPETDGIELVQDFRNYFGPRIFDFSVVRRSLVVRDFSKDFEFCFEGSLQKTPMKMKIGYLML